MAAAGLGYNVASINDDLTAIRIIDEDGVMLPRYDLDREIRDAGSAAIVGTLDGSGYVLYFGPATEGERHSLNLQYFSPIGQLLGEPTVLAVELGLVNSLSSCRLFSGETLFLVSSAGVNKDVGLTLTPAGEVTSVSLLPEAESVAALTGGGFVLSWTGADGFGTGIFAQVYSDTGVAESGPIRVNGVVQGNQFDSDVAGLSDGGFVVSWTDESHRGGDASETSVKARLYTLEGTDRPIGTIESSIDSEVLYGSPSKDVFFFDTVSGRPLGRDTIKNFGVGDYVVTTSPISDTNLDGRVRFDSSDRLPLVDSDGGSKDPLGSLKIFNENDHAISGLDYAGRRGHDESIYYIYVAAGDPIPPFPDLHF